MAATPKDGAASPSWVGSSQPRRTGSRSTLNPGLPSLGLASEGLLGGLRTPVSRRPTFDRLGNSCDVLGSISTAAARDVDQASPCKVSQITSHVLRTQIEAGFRQRIRQSGIGEAGD